MNQSCKKCSADFKITDEDLAFYKQVSPTVGGTVLTIPTPTLCVACRQQRRHSFRNERQLYKRASAMSGDSLICLYSPDKDIKAYSNKEWWSDNWNPMDYGRDFDFDRPFFEQFDELNKNVPKPALINDNATASENSEYTNDAFFNKNCYYVFCTWQSEEAYYSQWVSESDFTCDCMSVLNSRHVYDCTDCKDCSRSIYIHHSFNSHDCLFSYGLRNCSDCIFCTNLRGQQYCIENKQVSKEEYEAFIETIDTKSYANYQQYKEKIHSLMLSAPRQHMNMINCEDSRGGNLINCNNSFGFDFLGMDHCKYGFLGEDDKFCYDFTEMGKSELCYETATCDNSYQALFSTYSCENSYIFYCNNCHNSKYLFGCVGLRNKQYCIFNKQFTKEQWEQMVPKIVAYMTTTGEWGEFFPMSISPYGYNESNAQDYTPLLKQEALEKGATWSDYKKPPPSAEKDIPATALPDNLDDTPDDILNWNIVCKNTGTVFRLQKKELEFYRNLKVPIPRLCFEERHKQRIAFKNPRQLWNRQCSKCFKDIETTYSPDRPETVYCEECYLAAVY